MVSRHRTCLITDDGRECFNCGVFKDWEDYHPREQGPNGYASQCKVCKRINDLEIRDKARKKHGGKMLIKDTDHWWDGIGAQQFNLGRVPCQ